MFIREVKLLKLSSLLLILMLVLGTKSYGQSSDSSDAKKDTIFRSGLLDSMMERNDIISSNKAGNLDIDRVNKMAYVSVQQMLKGNLAGLYVQEPSGEPGTAQYMYVRGLVAPLLSAKDINGTQPTVYLNGIPMLKDNAFSYDMQHYDFATIGPSTNIMSIFDNNDIESIQLLKDPAVLAKLGPLATNGAIWITSKTAHSGPREISVNSYYGIAVKPVVTPINASWENNFRQPFYQKYGTVQDMVNYPTYLKDSSDLNYYGPANWVDDYYKNAPIHSVDLSLTGGS
ncbi:TonB-dependent receptor plug domain-containing protein, partial [Arachidicoccus sp.]|uniref:TonB-dependent receptor plug domain-containing protein n=1 Tax=Arachidicoccus sp. TaxID=1872624 RepID=UPI003D1B593C